MCKYCDSFNIHTYYSDALEEVDASDEGVGISFFRSYDKDDNKKHWYLCAEYEGNSEYDIPSKVAYTYEIKYCPFCGKELSQ